MMADFGEKVEATACSDASAAIGIAHRQGLGKTGHIEVQHLWIQREVKEGKLKVKKVSTSNNPADLVIKAMNGEKVMKYMEDMGGLTSTAVVPTPHRFDEHQVRSWNSEMAAC